VLAVPGNHDYCTRAAVQSGHFERYFAPWQDGERKIAADTRAPGRVLPFYSPAEPGKCLIDGAPSEKRVLFARAY